MKTAHLQAKAELEGEGKGRSGWPAKTDEPKRQPNEPKDFYARNGAATTEMLPAAATCVHSTDQRALPPHPPFNSHRSVHPIPWTIHTLPRRFCPV